LATQFQFATSSRAGVCPFERHFKPEELGKLWGLSANAIRALFEEEVGVLKIIRNEQLHKRKYTTLRIPESVAERVHARFDAIGIGGRVTSPPLPHHRTSGSASGGSKD
jgi:hypothetical protein